MEQEHPCSVPSEVQMPTIRRSAITTTTATAILGARFFNNNRVWAGRVQSEESELRKEGGLTGIMKQGDGRYSVGSSVEWASGKGTGRALGRLVRWVFFFGGIDNEHSKWDAGLETRHEEELCSLDCNRHINNKYITSTRQNLPSSFQAMDWPFGATWTYLSLSLYLSIYIHIPKKNLHCRQWAETTCTAPVQHVSSS